MKYIKHKSVNISPDEETIMLATYQQIDINIGTKYQYRNEAPIQERNTNIGTKHQYRNEVPIEERSTNRGTKHQQRNDVPNIRTKHQQRNEAPITFRYPSSISYLLLERKSDTILRTIQVTWHFGSYGLLEIELFMRDDIKVSVHFQNKFQN